MNEKNITALKTQLVQLGFEASVETMLRCHICFQPSDFALLYAKLVGKDRFQFCVHLEKGDRDQYEIRHYQATLRKDVTVPAELEPINIAMQSVDWHSLANGKLVAGQMDAASIQTAFEVLGKLQNVGTGADLLKYKYWVGTPLEPLVPQLPVMRNDWEISERFYVFDENLVINFNEAVRFLSSRWMEKQVAARKKLLVKKTVGGAGGSGVAGGKLLTKSPRKLARRGNDKSI